MIRLTCRACSAAMALVPLAASAHVAVGDAHGCVHGFSHPFSGLDHVLAMTSVGLLAARLGGRALWLVPLSFVAVMTVAGIAGMVGLTLLGAHLQRQFEFVQSQWVTDGNFISHGTEQDPLIGNNEGEGVFTIPKKPARRRLHGLPRFVTVRGGEYCFIPGLRALQWIASLDSSRT